MTKKLQKLELPLTYEDLISTVGHNTARMIDLIEPLTEFEEQIVQIVADMRNNGYLLFLYGVSGVGKSTFIASLAWRKHVPIKEIVSINAGQIQATASTSKMRELFQAIFQQVEKFRYNNNYEHAKPCIVIDYLESIRDERQEEKIAFFRDLNGLLRRFPVLIMWPVTVRDEVQSMQDDARSFSSTIFHRRVPLIEFTGPPTQRYSDIAKKTIMVLNPGREHYDFQINDDDFQTAHDRLGELSVEMRTIREYLQIVKDIWEERVDAVSKITDSIPGKTDVWFLFGYPGAEDVVASFSKKSPDAVAEAWSADYRQLAQYVRGQRTAEWKSQPDYNRLAVALSGALNVKIMYIPTNALVSIVAAYTSDETLREQLRETGMPSHWFNMSNAKQMFRNTPLFRQLNGEPPKIGKRRGSPAMQALEKAGPAYDVLNKFASRAGPGTDKPLNHAVAAGLGDIFEEGKYSFASEKVHLWLSNITPDILVSEKGTKDLICIEFHYTANKAPNQIASYVLGKLNTYMNQIEEMYNSGKHFLL